MTFPAEYVLSNRAIHLPDSAFRDKRNILDYLPPKTIPAAIHILGVLGLMTAAFGSAGEVHAAPLEPALNPNNVATWHDANLAFDQPDSVEPQGVESVFCPPIALADGLERNYQPPIVTCETYEYEDQTVLSYDIIPPNRPGLYLINPAPGKLVITSNIEGLFPFLAFYTNFRQQTLTADQIGRYLYDQDEPVDMQINGRRVPVKAKGMDVIVSCHMDENGQNCNFVTLADGTEISTYELIRQMFLSSGLNPDEYDLSYMTPSPMIDTSTEITDLFPVFVNETATPTPNPWLYSPTPTPTYSNPIYATAGIGERRDQAGNLLPSITIVETQPTIENPQAPVTGFILDFNLLDQKKINITHLNHDTRNPILSPVTDQAESELANTNSPLQMIALGQQITTESGSAWDNNIANLKIRVGGKYQYHHKYTHEKVVASELGQVQIKAVHVDDNHIAHFVGIDKNGGWVFFDLSRSKLKSYAKQVGFISTTSATGTNTILDEIIKTALTQKTQVKRNAFVIPSQFALSANQSNTWADAWRAATAYGTVTCFLPDDSFDPAQTVTVSCPVGMMVKPNGIYFDFYGTAYVTATVDGHPSGTPYSDGAELIIPATDLIPSDKQP